MTSPYFKQVEYLESSGTQYIDLGLKGKNGYDFDYKFNSTRIDSTAYGIGGEWESNKSCYLGLIRNTNKFAYHYQNTSSPVEVQTLTANTDYRVQAHLYSGEQYYIINGIKSSVGTIAGTFESTTSMNLFRVNSSSPIYSYIKVYYLKIWDNGTLVMDMIPVLDNDMVPAMYDRVTGTLKYNAGTGDFSYGAFVEQETNKKMLRKQLALMLASLKKKRPYYCEVEYLASTNQQDNSASATSASWIDTGIIPDDTTKIECRMAFTTLISGNNNEALCGSTGSGTGNYRFAWGFASVSPYTNFYFGLGGQNLTTTVVRDTNTHIFKLDAINKTWGIDSNTGAFTSSGSLAPDTSSIFLFARHNPAYGDDVANRPANANIYYCKIWKNGSLVRDLIPVLDWNYTPCMYDRATEQLFYNQGTGSFTYGREIHYVDYLESTGTQYINTGLLSTASSTVDTEFSFTSMESGVANNVGVFGGRNYTTTNTFTFFKIASGNPQYFRFDYNAQTTVGTETEMTWNTASKYRFQYNGTNCITTNTTTGESVITPRSPASTFTTNPICLFAVNTGGAIGQYLSGRIYYYKYSDGTKSVDMVPAIDENGVGFMFDRVSHTCFLNAGTGAFGYSAREVEYLESDGARAIVAGVTVDDTCGYDVKWMALNSNDTIILGTKGYGDSRWVLSGNNNPNVNISWNTSSGGVGLGLNKIQTAQMNYFNDRKRILNDTPLTDITQTLSANASTYSVGIFGGYWGASSISLYSTCRIYYAKISKGTGLIRDFVPMVKDGSPCLYDKVGGSYYFGTGTGSFTTGKIVEPKYD